VSVCFFMWKCEYVCERERVRERTTFIARYYSMIVPYVYVVRVRIRVIYLIIITNCENVKKWNVIHTRTHTHTYAHTHTHTNKEDDIEKGRG